MMRRLAVVAVIIACLGSLIALYYDVHSLPPQRGTLVLCGGGLDLASQDSEISRHVRRLSRRVQRHPGRPRVAALLSGSFSSATAYKNWASAPDDPGYLEYFSGLGFDATMVPIAIDTYNGKSYLAATKSVAVAEDQGWAKTISDADVVFLNGGDQSFHVRALLRDDGSDSLLLSAARKVLDRGGIVMGTSAGTHAQGAMMFGGGVSHGYIETNRVRLLTLSDQLGPVAYERNHEDLASGWQASADGFVVDSETGERNPIRPTFAVPNDDVGRLGALGRGLGFVSGLLFDSHSAARGRLGRMLVALATARHQPDSKNKGIAVGVDENTCLVWDRGARDGVVVGENAVWIVDIGDAELPAANEAPFHAKNVLLSYLTTGDRFGLTADGRLGPVSSAKELTPTAWRGEGELGGDMFAKDRVNAALCELLAGGWARVVGKALPPVDQPGKPGLAYTVALAATSDTRVYGHAPEGQTNRCSDRINGVTVDRLRLQVE